MRFRLTNRLVFQPQGFAKGLSLSADWYQVKIASAITTPSASQLARDCHDHDTFCDRINHGVDPDTMRAN